MFNNSGNVDRSRVPRKFSSNIHTYTYMCLSPPHRYASPRLIPVKLSSYKARCANPITFENQIPQRHLVPSVLLLLLESNLRTFRRSSLYYVCLLFIFLSLNICCIIIIDDCCCFKADPRSVFKKRDKIFFYFLTPFLLHFYFKLWNVFTSNSGGN